MSDSINSINEAEPQAHGIPPAQSSTPASLERRRIRRLQAGAQVIIATAVVLAICYVAELPLVVVLVSILLSFVLAPIADFLVRHRLPRGVAALFAVLLMLGALYGAFYFSYSRAQDFLRELPRIGTKSAASPFTSGGRRKASRRPQRRCFPMPRPPASARLLTSSHRHGPIG